MKPSQHCYQDLQPDSLVIPLIECPDIGSHSLLVTQYQWQVEEIRMPWIGYLDVVLIAVERESVARWHPVKHPKTLSADVLIESTSSNNVYWGTRPSTYSPMSSRIYWRSSWSERAKESFSCMSDSEMRGCLEGIVAEREEIPHWRCERDKFSQWLHRKR